jgi:uncharacterized membrane protein
MDKRKADNFFVVLLGAAAVLVLLPVFGVFRDKMDGFFFAAFLCLMNAFLIKGLGK